MSTSPAYEFYDDVKNRPNTVMSNGSSATPSRADYYLQPVPLTPQQQQQQPLLLGNGNGELPTNARTEFFRLDTRYLRSLEGVVRCLSLVSTWSYCMHTHTLSWAWPDLSVRSGIKLQRGLQSNQNGAVSMMRATIN